MTSHSICHEIVSLYKDLHEDVAVPIRMMAAPMQVSGFSTGMGKHVPWKCLGMLLIAFLIYPTMQICDGIYARVKVFNDRSPINRQGKLRVLTVASHLTQESCQYVLASAAHFNIDIHLLAYQDRAVYTALQDHSPNSIKIIASYQLVRTLPEDDLIMMVDGFDVVFQGGIDDILKEYEALESPPILYSSDGGCWPTIMQEEGYCDLGKVHSSAKRRFINSGGVIGRAGELARMWKALIEQDKSYFRRFNSRGHYWSEQGTTSMSYYIGNPYNISLDSDQRIFRVAYGDIPEFGADGRFHHSGDGSQRHAPPVVHFNGPTREALWNNTAWLRQHYSVQNNSKLSFRVNLLGERMTWSQLCGSVPENYGRYGLAPVKIMFNKEE